MTKTRNKNNHAKPLVAIIVATIVLLGVFICIILKWESNPAVSNNNLGTCQAWENKRICTGVFIGLKESKAARIAEDDNLMHRVIERDGKGLPHTADYQPNRVNFFVEDGIVVRAEFG